MNAVAADNLFLDSSGLLCVFDTAERRHQPAAAYFHAAKRLFTTNYVLAEFVPLSNARGLVREDALNFINNLILVPRLKLVWIDETRHEAAMKLLENRLDKQYSLCDAVSFLVMNEHQLLPALTTDHHFEQAGFVKLLES